MTQKPLKLLQVGVGGWGWSWLQVVTDSEAVELAGIVDVESGARARAQADFNVPEDRSFSSVGEALAHVEAEAALIVVPPEYHAPVAIEALNANLHCLVEKPLAGTIQDARAILEATEKSGRKLMVSQNYRFKRAPQTVKRLLARRVIGEIGAVHVLYQKNPRFGGFRAQMAEPLITDMAIHHFDQMRGILGLEPATIRAFSWNPRWSTFAGNANAAVLIEMTNGAIVSYHGTWASQGSQTTWDGSWCIQGDEGEIFWADNKVEVRPSEITRTVFMKEAVERGGVLHADLVPLPAEERWASLAEFAAAINEDREPETSGRDNLRSMAMVLGATLAAKENRTVTVDEVLAGYGHPESFH